MQIKFNSILLSIILSGILIVSCKKEQSPIDQNEIPANDLRLANMIKSFRAKGESGLKSTSEMSIDSAIWYISATANYTYGDPSYETERTWSESIFITLPVTNGKITEAEVYDKYEQIIDSLRLIYQKITDSNKQLIAVSVQAHDLNENSLECKVTGIFSSGQPIGVQCSFNDIDYWSFSKYWGNGGICGGINQGTHPESDAAKEIQKRIKYCTPVPAGNHWYESPYNEVIDDPSLYPIIPNSDKTNFHYAYMYWNSSQYHNPDIEGCLSPSDLNFYLTKTKEWINSYTTVGGLRQPGYNYIDIEIEGEEKFVGGYTIYKHKAKVYYGILHFGVNPPEEL
jgi:hypothetical protein